jgi:hypothetical protein
MENILKIYYKALHILYISIEKTKVIGKHESYIIDLFSYIIHWGAPHC